MTRTQQHAEKLRRDRHYSLTTKPPHPGSWQEFAQGLEDELTTLKAYLNRDVNSDWVVSSCSCLAKSADPERHRKGCKYRLIMERDTARTAARKLRDAFAKGERLPWE